MKLISLTSILVYAFLGYIFYSLYSIYSIFKPSECHTKDERLCLNPAFKPDDNFQLFLCTSLDSHPLATKLNCIYHNASFVLSQPLNLHLDVTLPPQTVNNGSLFVHAILTKLMSSRLPNENVLKSRHTVTSTAYLTKYAKKKDKIFNLLDHDYDVDDLNQNVNGTTTTNNNKRSRKQRFKRDQRPVTHWKKRFVLNGLHEPFSMFKTQLPYEILHLMKLNAKQQYMPVIYISDVRQQLQDLMEIDITTKVKETVTVPLEVVYEPISIGRLRFTVIVETALRTMKKIGFQEQDIEDAQGIFFETNFHMLLLTITIVALHALFDFLAFKNDIQFWRHRDTMEGISFNTVFVRFISSFIITLYLLDRDTSFMILIPMAIGTIIELWKLKKILHLEWSGGWRLVQTAPSSRTSIEKLTIEYDGKITKWLSFYLLPPLLISGAVYSILYVEHRSWYSWLIQSAANGVYAFGFIAMLPQLFINYKLKSVAHLPWRVFMYKAFNTFIDDFFAFLLTSVPTSHRLATFRDDFIFLIYLYQRWLYPIDKSRGLYASQDPPSDDAQTTIKKDEFNPNEAQSTTNSDKEISPGKSIPKESKKDK